MEVPGSPFGGCASTGSVGGGLSSRHRCKHSALSASSRRPDGDMALQDMEGVLHNGITNGSSSAMSRKRLRMDVDQENEMEQLKQIIAVRGRNFIPIAASPTTFQTEDVKQKSETIYLPLTDDILVNMRSAEQISYGAGVYFVGDDKGSYARSSQGHVVNLWRYSEARQKLFISRSFLFTNVMDFVQLKEILENL
eukprot:XP_003728540.1 PREDICTED: uncharacterized protein LOC100889051 isoform X2 [Strongylocentrotus purpuratus]